MLMKNILRPTLVRLIAAFLPVLTATMPAWGGRDPDVLVYLVAKGQHFRQVGAAAPALVPGSNGPFRFVASVVPRYANAVATASVQPPAGGPLTLEQDPKDPAGEFSYDQAFATKAALDGGFGAGAYRFTIAAAFDSLRMPAVTLGGDAYPTNAPRVINWSSLQGADPTAPVTIRWDPLAGGTTNDFVQIFIEDGNGEIDSTPGPGKSGRLNGTATFHTIEAGRLTSNTTYKVFLLFAKVTPGVHTNYPGVPGWAAYFKETEAEFTTGAPPPPPPVAGRFVLSSGAYSVTEASESVTITVLRQGGTTGSASVTLISRAGTATADQDFDEATNVVVFNDGVTAVNVPVEISNDDLLEGNETILLALSNPTGGADLGTLTNATLTIVDDEDVTRGVFQLAPASVVVEELAGRVTLTINRTRGSAGEVSVGVVTRPISAEEGLDYLPFEGSLVFSNGVMSRTITIPIINDSLDESNELVQVELVSSSDGAALGENHVATITIRDNDTAGSVSFSAASYVVGETGGVVNVIVRRVGGGASDVSVDFATQDITATSPEHYCGTNFTIQLGSNELVRTIPIEIKPDRLPDGDQTFRATLRNPSPGARIGPITNAIVTIRDDEVTLQFTATAVSNRENAAIAIVMVERLGPLNVAASVDVSTIAGGTATAGVDYLATNLTVQFPPTVRRKPVGIRLLNDQIVEGNETVQLELSNPSANALIGARSNVVLTIVEDDAGGKIQFALTNITVPERRTGAVVIVTRTMGLASNVTVRLRTTDLSAGEDADYSGLDLILNWRGNEVLKRITVPLHPDGIVEGTEQFRISLSDPTGGATLDTKSNMTVNITDDDSGGVIGFARAEYVVNEHGTNAAILITRTGGSASNVTVRFQALEDSAASPADFTEQNITLHFAAGELSKTVLVPINNDTLPEGAPETVALSLRQFTGGARPSAVSNATLRIVDDESSVAFGTNMVMGTEGTTATLTVFRAGALTTQVSVNFSTMGGTATEGTDYTATSGTLTFAPSQASKTITVRIASDSTAETNESFTVVLSNPQGGVQLGGQSSITVAVKDAPDPNAIPLSRAPFLSQTARPVANTTFSRNFSVNPGSAGHVVNGSFDEGIDRLVITAVVAGASGQETMQFSLYGVTGPGTFNVARPGNTADCTYTRVSPSGFFGWVSTVTGVSSGTITLDNFNGTKATGRYNLILAGTSDNSQTIRVVGSFSSNVQ